MELYDDQINILVADDTDAYAAINRSSHQWRSVGKDVLKISQN